MKHICAWLAAVAFVVVAMAQQESEFSDDVLLDDDVALGFGGQVAVAPEFKIQYNSGTGLLELTDGTNTLLSVADAGTTGNAIITGNLTVDTPTLYVSASNNSVGIGTTSDALDAPLHILKTGTVNTSLFAATVLALQRDGNAGDQCLLQLLGSNTGYVKVLFGDVDDMDVGQISYNHSTNEMAFTTNGAAAMSLSSAGSIVITGDGSFNGGDLSLGVSATTRGTITALHGAGANTAGYFKPYSKGGTPQYVWVTDAGRLRVSSAAPTADTDGAFTDGQSVYVVGDLLYASSTTALSRLADVATGNALLSGGVGTAPAYGKIGLTTHVSGILPTANGGTGVSTFTTASVAELNAIADDRAVEMYATTTDAGTDETTATFQARDAAGSPIARVYDVRYWLSDAASGYGLTGTTASGAVALSAGQEFSTLVAKKAFMGTTNASGTLTISITDTAHTLYYVCCTVPATGETSVIQISAYGA